MDTSDRYNKVFEMGERAPAALEPLLERPKKRMKYDGSAVPEQTFNKDIVVGTIMTDIKKNKWRVGQPIGKGNYGEVFLASMDTKHTVTSLNANYVVKIEQHSSGPLFAEINCLFKTGRPTDESPLTPGMVQYIASGSHTFNKKRYRFLVLPRYKFDLHSVIKNRCIDEKEMLVIAIQTLDVLQYLHGKGYVHVDIKAANMLIGNCPRKSTDHTCDDDDDAEYRSDSEQSDMRPHDDIDYADEADDDTEKIKQKPAQNTDYNEDRIFLIDFGLALKYRAANGTHKPFCVNERIAHDGTLEFTSRDAHMGAHSRRSDLESLGYNLLLWSQGWLPWDNKKLLKQPEQVHRVKELFMLDIREGLKQVYDDKVPKYLGDFLQYVDELAYPATPDYDFCRGIFLSALQRLGIKSKDMKIDVNRLKSSPLCTVNKNKDIRALLSVGTKINLRSKSDKIPRKQLWWNNSDPDQIAKQRAEKELENVPTETALVVRYAGKPNKVILTLENRLKPDTNYNIITNNTNDMPDATNWTVQQVYDYYKNIFPRHAHLFEDQEIDGEVLYQLKRRDIVGRFQLKMGPSLKIYDHIKRMQKEREN